MKLPGWIQKRSDALKTFKKRLDYLYASKIYSERSYFFNGRENVYFLNLRESNKEIYSLLMSDTPVMIGRHGGTEVKLAAGFDTENKIVFLDELCFSCGFFPESEQLVSDWAELYLNASRDLDFICEWNYRYGRYNEVQHIFAKYSPEAKVGNDLEVLTPFLLPEPWTRALKGKRVLVVHPFSKTIQSQYKKREQLFENPDILPEFASLETVTTVWSGVGNTDHGFADWFEVYDYLCAEISKHDFDVALIGCGCYGLTLASYVKSLGKSAVHVGGGLQLLFGIRGGRWDKAQRWIDVGLYNEHWVRPSEEETPKKYKSLEGGAYW